MAEPCKLAIHPTEAGYVVRIIGRGTMRESPAVRDFVCGAIEDGAQTILDLSSCEYLDSTFLGCLVLLHKRALRSKGSFAVHADTSVRQRLLESVRLLEVLHFSDECPAGAGLPVTLEVTGLERQEFCRHLFETHRKLAELGGAGAEAFHRIADQLEAEFGAISRERLD